jgi:flagellar biosynthetic protein FlhB
MSQGADKTEKATAKKRRDARKEGQVRQSQEVNTTFSLIVMLGLLLFIWRWFVERLTGIYMEHLGTQSIIQASTGLSTDELMNLFTRILLSMIGVLFPILGVALIAGVFIHVAQIGFNFTTKPLQMKFSKINPINGFKRLFSTRTLVELAKSILKITLIGYIAYGDYMNLLNGFPYYVGQDPYTAFMQFMSNAFTMGLRMCIVMVFIAIADFLYQWWKYEKDLRMTKQEVKDEYKMMEGDPQIKGKIRQKQRQMSAMRMMSRVPEADVVITNPTHYAVALKYDDKENPAPVVTAKGIDYLALKIKAVALENDVEVVENPPLAQSLYAMCEVDDVIPADLYQAVADVLVFVYRQKGKIR